ncbi:MULTISPECIES: hypothetical protein [unclassified Leifsonia]|uniref:hypothetical protein n=1 Tax=unclassified Leifsonia TaxID=2663824 RepID=UPI00105F668A|nr:MULTISPECIES: hypothetical protein [unclassified Leifsonia]TDP99508.1 hypothetical protein AXZ95_3429 [Leifsonia sp. 115AMFTsu3.1]
MAETRVTVDSPIAELRQYYRDKRKILDDLEAPQFVMSDKNPNDLEWQREKGLVFALDFIDVLLERLEIVEGRIAKLEETASG